MKFNQDTSAPIEIPDEWLERWGNSGYRPKQAFAPESIHRAKMLMEKVRRDETAYSYQNTFIKGTRESHLIVIWEKAE